MPEAVAMPDEDSPSDDSEEEGGNLRPPLGRREGRGVQSLAEDCGEDAPWLEQQDPSGPSEELDPDGSDTCKELAPESTNAATVEDTNRRDNRYPAEPA